jgi:hypothetical protein
MNPRTLVNLLLDGLPGADQRTLNDIMSVIYTIADRIETYNPRVDRRRRFEQEINPALEKYGVRFVANDPELSERGPVAKTDLSGVTALIPWRVDRQEFHNMREVLSHELVHADQIKRAMLTGNAAKMYTTARGRMMPGGVLDRAAYAGDPHETTAYARSLIDQMRLRGLTRSGAIQALRQGAVRAFGPQQEYPSEKVRKRFLKHAAGYAEQIPEGNLSESPQFDTLKQHQKPLTDEERDEVLQGKAVWHHNGANGTPSPAIKKSQVDGNTWYWSNTHRCYSANRTLKAAINAFREIVEPSS